jgi:hypothetical protein
MSIGRNAIYAALFNLLQTAPGFVTYGTRLQFPNQVSAQPALFLRRTDDLYEPRVPATRPATVILMAEVIIYYKTDDPDETPAIDLDTLLENVEAVLTPGPTYEATTLGGLVKRCYIEGTIRRDDGALYGQAGLIVPLKILVTSLGF